MSNVYVPPPESDITPEDWQQTPECARAWITVLGEEVKQLKAAVEKRQAIVNRHSGNSSQPPSQDRPEQKPTKEKPRQPQTLLSMCWSMIGIKRKACNYCKANPAQSQNSALVRSSLGCWRWVLFRQLIGWDRIIAAYDQLLPSETRAA
jgi:hypothetical protein